MKPKANPRALLPVLVFLVLYLGMGVLFEYVLKIPMGFYSIPIVVVFLVALLVACCQNKALKFDDKLEVMAQGVSDKNIMTMILIFLAAGVFVGGAGLLAFAASDGLFDIIRYGLGKVLRLALGKERREAYPKTFFDYRLAKQGRGVAGLSAVAAGLLSVGVAGLFLVLS